jgi:hypothetical protein
MKLAAMKLRTCLGTAALLAAACSDAVEPGGLLSPKISTGFRPEVDGFSFRNYDNTGVKNLTPSDMKKILGDAACRKGSGGGSAAAAASASADANCTLRPVYGEMMKLLNRTMNGGHCEGLAALSGLIFQGNKLASDFGAKTTYALKLPGNELLQREVASYYAYQIFDPTREARVSSIALGPAGIVGALEAAFKQGKASEMFTLAIYKPGLTAGHAITPYAVERFAGGMAKVYVYDNNFPGQERALEVNLTADSWKYIAASNPNLPAALYEGDRATGTLGITKNAVRREAQRCTLCEKVAADRGELVGERRILVGGDAHLLISDSSGARLGYDQGQYVDTMSDGEGIPLFGVDLAEASSDPVYRIAKPGADVLIDGTDLSRATDVSVVNLGPGVLLELREDDLQPGERSRLTYGQDGRTMRYTPGHSTRATLVAALQFAGEDWQIELTGQVGPGADIELSTDAVTGQVRVRASGIAEGLQLTMLRLRDQAAIFGQRALAIGSSETLQFDLRAWAGEGASIAQSRDLESDGVVDSVAQLPDEL